MVSPENWEDLMNLFKSEDWEVLKYNVFDPAKEERICRIESFRLYRGPHRKELIRYIVLMNDKRSPVIKHFRDLNVRRIEAARIAGLDSEDKAFFDKLNNFEFSDYAEMVMDFLIDQNDYWWSMILSNELTFYEYQKAIAQGVINFSGDKDKLNAIAVKSKLLEDSDTIANRLESYYLKVFGDPELAKKAQSRNAFTPEKMARGNV